MRGRDLVRALAFALMVLSALAASPDDASFEAARTALAAIEWRSEAPPDAQLSQHTDLISMASVPSYPPLDTICRDRLVTLSYVDRVLYKVEIQCFDVKEEAYLERVFARLGLPFMCRYHTDDDGPERLASATWPLYSVEGDRIHIRLYCPFDQSSRTEALGERPSCTLIIENQSVVFQETWVRRSLVSTRQSLRRAWWSLQEWPWTQAAVVASLAVLTTALATVLGLRWSRRRRRRSGPSRRSPR